MLILSETSSAPQEVPLGGGATITVRPANLIEVEQAVAGVRRAVSILREGGAMPAHYGLTLDLATILGVDGGGEGLAELMSLVEITLVCASGWQGVGLEDGSPAPLTRENLARLLLDPNRADRVRNVVYGPLHRVSEEGEGSPPSSSGEPGAASRTAGTAASSGRRARRAAKAGTASGAPKSKAHPRHRKGRSS